MHVTPLTPLGPPPRPWPSRQARVRHVAVACCVAAALSGCVLTPTAGNPLVGMWTWRDTAGACTEVHFYKGKQGGGDLTCTTPQGSSCTGSAVPRPTR